MAKQLLHKKEKPDQHDQLLDILRLYHQVPIKSLELDTYRSQFEWCFDHCEGKFRDLSWGEGAIWYFEYEKDAVVFALKWGIN